MTTNLHYNTSSISSVMSLTSQLADISKNMEITYLQDLHSSNGEISAGINWVSEGNTRTVVYTVSVFRNHREVVLFSYPLFKLISEEDVVDKIEDNLSYFSDSLFELSKGNVNSSVSKQFEADNKENQVRYEIICLTHYFLSQVSKNIQENI